MGGGRAAHGPSSIVTVSLGLGVREVMQRQDKSRDPPPLGPLCQGGN